MGFFVTDYMKTWLNTTYEYLKETGGPVRPPSTVGIDVLPSGPFSIISQDIPVTYDVPPTIAYDIPQPTRTFPFNQGNIGLPVLNRNKNETNAEIAKENPTPQVLSNSFAKLYGGMMDACIADQTHRACNPDALTACREFAETGNTSKMMFMPVQREAVGLEPPPQENDKSDEARAAEIDASLIGQMNKGATDLWSFVASVPSAIIGEGGPVPAENPEGVNFRGLGDKLAGIVPSLPNAPQINSGTLLVIGSGVVLLILVVVLIK